LAFTKTVGGGTYFCNFDFGSWRRTVVAIFVCSELGCRVTTAVRYSRSGKDIAILDAELFEQTMANVAFAVGEIETVLTCRASLQSNDCPKLRCGFSPGPRGMR
jgi:hypothetical protein